jgi:cyclin T
MSSQSSAGGPAIHHPHSNYHPYIFQHDPPLHSNSRRRRRNHDDPYQPYLPLPHAHSHGATAVVTGTVRCHVPRDPLVLSHLQERLFPTLPQHHPIAGPPPTKRARRAPDTPWDPPPPTLQPALVPVALERPPDVGHSAGALLSRDEIERRSPSRRDGIDSALEARLRASYCAYLHCLGNRLGL